MDSLLEISKWLEMIYSVGFKGKKSLEAKVESSIGTCSNYQILPSKGFTKERILLLVRR